MAITVKTRKLLWGLAANRCSICRVPLTRLPSGASDHTIVGEEAHIVAQAGGGARSQTAPPGGDIDGYDNLILLCRNDHRLVDDQPEVYPIERLLDYKRGHERWVAEVLDDARGGTVDVGAALERLERESAARCVERWQALGLPRTLALALTADEQVGVQEIDRSVHPVLVLIGDAGVGKSLAGERAHQQDVQTARQDRSAPLPIWVRARDLSEGLADTIAHAGHTLGAHRADAPISLVVDGLDEVGPANAASLLGEIRVAVGVRPGSRAIATSRLLDAIGNDDERRLVRPLSEDGARELVALVSGNEQVSLWRFPEAIKEAAKRPLFAIALGHLIADQPTYSPVSPAEVLDGMVRSAVADDWEALREPLTKLALASLRRSGGPVRAADIVPAHQLQRLLATRLVVEDRGRLRFPLIVIAQWFAGEAILDGAVDAEELLAQPADLELWRYPLAVAIVRASEDRASEILVPFAERAPAFISVVVSETVRQHGGEEPSDVGTWQEAGHAIRNAEAAWARGLGSLAQAVAPVAEDGNLQALGVNVVDGWLTTAWYNGDEPREEMFQLEPSFFPLSSPAGYGPSRSARPPGGSAWAWRWTRDELSGTIGHLLSNRRLVLAGTPLEHEAVWTVALQALNLGNLTSEPVDVSWLLTLSPTVDVIATRTRFVEVRGLSDALARHVDAEGFLSPPWPGPDRSMAGPWVWSDFSPERVCARAEAIYAAALAGYQHFAEGLFAHIAPRMRVAVTLPGVARGTISFSTRAFAEGAPALAWTLEPQESGATRVEFQLGARPSLEARLDGLDEALKSARPLAARWIHAVAHHEVLDIFGSAPAAQLAYKWLWDDLQVLGWVPAGSVGSNWPTGHPPRLA